MFQNILRIFFFYLDILKKKTSTEIFKILQNLYDLVFALILMKVWAKYVSEQSKDIFFAKKNCQQNFEVKKCGPFFDVCVGYIITFNKSI